MWGCVQAARRVGCALFPAGKAWMDNPGSWLLQLLAKIKHVVVLTET